MRKFKMSALLSRAAFAVGVALCVTPIFTFAQSSNSSRMFNDVQAMRLEIAELRDMVERQQFELQKLKRAQAQAASGSTAAPAYGAQGPVGQGPAYAVPQAPISQPQVQAQGPALYPVFSQTADIQNADVLEPASNVGLASISNGQPQSAPVQAVPQDDSSYYRPYPDTEQSQGVPVSSAVVTAPPLQDTGYPPVVDRSIGGSGVSTQYPSGNQNTAQEDYSIRQIQQVVPRAVLNAPEPSYGGSLSSSPATIAAPVVEAGVTSSRAGVIAVPGAVATVDQGAAAPQGPQFASVPAPSQTAPGLTQAATTQTAPTQTIAGYSQQGNTQSILGQPAVAAPNLQQTQVTAAPALAEADYYQQGFNLLKQSKHQDAVNVFERQIAAYPQGEYADDAYYWIAESTYVNRDLDQSKKSFKAIIDNYKQSPRLPDAMLKTAYIEQDQGNKLEAQLLLQEILQFHPRSNAAISAKNRLAEMNN
jgi:tol-pal system protein YbgF